ncbi:TetR/AcrR family transcriptional regulator [Desulfuribacillus alkaliarsenatis]|uniref:Transcriptional regulator n=1 Tax=Desulfuribacillus alkaliarsenatis TaxID=766136 RepID=A0A1E5FYQ2_9FIRM|nr:TetR/AcrR family transcriptional regulator [Desulfuribacillus alkaliarsenatis]OEF95702.1 transcriptional regulator [Desulfuribacillus alkaliarsenatis]
MNIKNRQERDREERRELILNAASEIIMQEGIEKLSVRKIGKKIEYSPAIIYHYFKDMDEIIFHVMSRGYQKIIGALASLKITSTTPDGAIKERTRAYINVTLEMGEDYKYVMLNKSPHVKQHTAHMFKGASASKPALAILCRDLKALYPKADDEIIELTAQAISASTFGLIMRLLIEDDIDDTQRERLINHFINTIVDGMIKSGIDYTNKTN